MRDLEPALAGRACGATRVSCSRSVLPSSQDTYQGRSTTTVTFSVSPAATGAFGQSAPLFVSRTGTGLPFVRWTVKETSFAP